MRVAERVLDVDSTLTGEKVRMGIDEHAMQHIIGVLTDLYSDPELAVIREYSTNALDANREAGNSGPIEVTLPTPLAPFFRVKDSGIGMDAEDIRRTYSKYGASTKRDSDEQVGMLGLGAKSALTYTDQFTIVGTKNGRTVQVSVGRDEDGGGSMTIVSDEPRTEGTPNGVEVIVPVKRDNDFEDKAREFFKFWTPGTVLLNGEAPTNITDQVEPTWLVEDELFVFTDERRGYRGADTGWVVMGNVAYPIPDDAEGFPDRYDRKYSIVAYVEIGAVNFTPSREALMLTKRTKETLAKIREDVTRELAVAAQKKVENADTPADAIRFTQEAAAFGVKTEGIKYQGRDVPTELDRTKRDKDGNVISVSDAPEGSYLIVNGRGGNYRRKNGERYRKIPPFGSSRLVFHGFTSKEMSLPMRTKLDVWHEEQGIDKPQEYIVVDQLTADERFWFTGTPIHDWTPIKEIKLAKGDSSVGPSWNSRPRGSYELAGNAGSILAEDIDTTNPILYCATNERYIKREQNRIPTNATLVVLPANRKQKFLRDFPTAVEWGAYVQKEAKDWLKQQDPEKLAAVKLRLSGALTSLTGLDHTRVDDPELSKAIQQANDKTLAEIERGVEARQHFLQGWSRYDLRQSQTEPLKKYPLALDSYGRAMRLNGTAEHFYLYVNAAYAA